MLYCRISCLKACLSYILVKLLYYSTCYKSRINTKIWPPPPSIVYRNLPVLTPCSEYALVFDRHGRQVCVKSRRVTLSSELISRKAPVTFTLAWSVRNSNLEWISWLGEIKSNDWQKMWAGLHAFPALFDLYNRHKETIPFFRPTNLPVLISPKSKLFSTTRCCHCFQSELWNL